jgi:hypothetical protein
MLLPLAPQPFTAPTDRDMLPSERRAFIYTHRTCVFGYRRLHDGPAMSVVYCVPTDTDDLLIFNNGGLRESPRRSAGRQGRPLRAGRSAGRLRFSRCTPTQKSSVSVIWWSM